MAKKSAVILESRVACPCEQAKIDFILKHDPTKKIAFLGFVGSDNLAKSGFHDPVVFDESNESYLYFATGAEPFLLKHTYESTCCNHHKDNAPAAAQ